MKKPFWCRVGFHAWESVIRSYTGKEYLTGHVWKCYGCGAVKATGTAYVPEHMKVQR